jgi:hypothetical protein
MNPKHQEKIDELINSLAATMRTTAQRLYSSGAIDVDGYNPDDFVLARILVTAAIDQHRYDFAPPIKYRGDVANLKSF